MALDGPVNITETSLFQTAKYDSANQKSRDDEKSDPDKATFNPFWKRVELPQREAPRWPEDHRCPADTKSLVVQ
jgi:hypothetical protein